MTVYIGPAGAPVPSDPASDPRFQPLGWIDGGVSLAPEPDDTHRAISATQHGTFTATLERIRGPRMQNPLHSLFGPYKHPRPVLHNGRKP